ncbi:hypothetical protein BpHYR1_028419 [Brachionus plicatilis]|uniref:Uncharacterized protein n=1 Tax=Brachionus plicatilis TaxID=10195 RepID=A0A3M7S2G7_BRAPC|nr:hypothetical protein BpHYR1_028419 [Brachionus plicatilis]
MFSHNHSSHENRFLDMYQINKKYLKKKNTPKKCNMLFCTLKNKSILCGKLSFHVLAHFSFHFIIIITLSHVLQTSRIFK